MTQDLLKQLPYAQVVEFCNLPSPLIFSQEDANSDSDLLIALVQFIGGHKTWDDILCLKVAEKLIVEALRVAVEAGIYDYTLDEKSMQLLDDAWKDELSKLKNKKQSTKAQLGEITKETQEAYFYAKELLVEIDSFIIEEDFPKSFNDIEKFQKTLAGLNRCKSDSQDIMSIAEDEKKASHENLYDFSEKALKRLFSLFKQGSLIDKPHSSKIFRLLPDIILNKQISVLKRIADDTIDLDDIEIAGQPPSSAIKFRAIRASKRMAVSSNLVELKPQGAPDHKLSAYSSSTYNAAPALEASLVNPEEIDTLRREAENIINHIERAYFWLGLAKSCSNNHLKSAALGEGLLATGMDLIAKGQFLNARLTLVDAFVNLVISNNLGLYSRERCAFALLSSVVWPQAINQRVADGNGTIWVDQPALMFELLKKGEFLSLVGKIWITELHRDDVAESFLSIVSAYIGDDKILYKECCGQLLTAQKVLTDCELVVRRLWRLLKDASPSKKLLEKMQKIADEIPAEAIINIGKINGYMLKELTKDLKLQLEALSQKNIAPVYETKLLFPEVLEEIIQKSSLKGKGLSEPNLTIEQMVTVFFPEEQSEDLELPIVVRNSDNAGFASDVILDISCKEGESCCPNIEETKLEFEDIQPGQSKEKVLLIDIPDEIVGERTEIRFQLQLRLGNTLLGKKKKEIVVGIQPSASREYRSSPYTVGAAVVGLNFIGREKEIAHIKSTLAGDSDQKVLLLYGIRRIGKTSILKNILEDPEITRRYYPIFWDVEDFSDRTSTTDFVQTLVDKIIAVLPGKVGEGIAFSRKEIREKPLYAMEKFFQSVDAIDSQKRILLIIDEVDRLLHLAKKTEECLSNGKDVTDPEKFFFPEVIAALRKCTMINKDIFIIFSGLPDIVEQEYQSRLFGLADDIEVKELSETESIKIIQAGGSIMKINTFIQDKIVNVSGCQPYLLQVLCNKLFHRMKNSGRDMVANFDLNEVIEEIASKESIFTDYDSLMTEGWDLLYGLALAQKEAVRSRKYVSSQEIEEALARVGLEYSKDEIEKTLNSYLVGSTKRPLVRRDPHNSRRFSMVVGLIGSFLVRKGGRV